METKRGRNGGITLGMKLEDIRIGMLERRTDTCPLSGMCRLKGILGEAAQAFYNTLDTYTLKDLVNGPERARMQALLLTPTTP